MHKTKICSDDCFTLTRREQVAKLAARSLIDVIWATATRTELAAAAMADSESPARDCTDSEFKREQIVSLGWRLGSVDDNLTVLRGSVMLRVRWKQNDMSFDLKKRTLAFTGSLFLSHYRTPKLLCNFNYPIFLPFLCWPLSLAPILIHSLVSIS